MLLACEQVLSCRQAQQKLRPKRRAREELARIFRSQIAAASHGTACQLSNFNQSAHAGSQNPQQTKNDTRVGFCTLC